MKKLTLELFLWGFVLLATATVYAQLGIGGVCTYSSWCNCTMERHMMQAWCGGTGMSSWCYNSSHWCQYSGY